MRVLSGMVILVSLPASGSLEEKEGEPEGRRGVSYWEVEIIRHGKKKKGVEAELTVAKGKLGLIIAINGSKGEGGRAMVDVGKEPVNGEGVAGAPVLFYGAGYELEVSFVSAGEVGRDVTSEGNVSTPVPVEVDSDFVPASAYLNLAQEETYPDMKD